MAETATTLEQLDALLGQSKSLSEIQRDAEKVTSSLQSLKDEVALLRKRHHELALQLFYVPQTQSLCDVLMTELKDKAVVDHNASQILHRVSEHKSEELKKRKVTDKVSAYRLAGRTLFPVDAKNVGIRFDTAYQGRYFEPFYIILQIDERGREAAPLRVFRHTVPYFIPMQRLEKELLRTNLRQFVDEVSNFIDAYVTRREQLLHLQRQFTLQNVASNAAFDLVQFDVLYKERPFQVRLIYSDLRSSIPKKAAVIYTRPPDTQKRRHRRCEERFVAVGLVEAFKSCFAPETDGDAPGHE